MDEQTGTITWPGDVDLDPDVIYAALNLAPTRRESTSSLPALPPDAPRVSLLESPGAPLEESSSAGH